MAKAGPYQIKGRLAGKVRLRHSIGWTAERIAQELHIDLAAVQAFLALPQTVEPERPIRRRRARPTCRPLIPRKERASSDPTTPPAAGPTTADAMNGLASLYSLEKRSGAHRDLLMKLCEAEKIPIIRIGGVRYINNASLDELDFALEMFRNRPRPWAGTTRGSKRNAPDPTTGLVTRTESATSSAPVQKPAVELGKPGEPAIVMGKEKRGPTEVQRQAIMALLGVWPKGLAMKEMDAACGGKQSWRNTLRRLKKSDEDWDAAIIFPSEGSFGEHAQLYRIGFA